MRKIVIVNKSDSTGGAAVVSFRLLQALRSLGVDARMIVAERLTDSPYVGMAASSLSLRRAFLAERLGIFLANGLDRSTLFRIDTAADGVDIAGHPWVREADAVLLNWVNQGVLSLKGLRRLIASGKKILWTMHDMWCFTGVCHHADNCEGWLAGCESCPLLQKRGACKSLARKTHAAKVRSYGPRDSIRFVAVSNWLADLARKSTLLADRPVSVIPNAFPIEEYKERPNRSDSRLRLLFGAARLDDPIKGLPILVAATRHIAREYPSLARRLTLVTFGAIRNPEALADVALPIENLGMIRGEGKLEEIYRGCDILVSTSHYETLPGTLVEAQAYGAVPVAFDRGGQRDIVAHLSTGYLADYSEDEEAAARAIAEGILWASEAQSETMRRRMHASVLSRFSPAAVAAAVLSEIKN